MNIKRIFSIISAVALLCGIPSAQAETPEILSGLKYEVNAGINIGGTSPLPLPSEIRSIDHFNPNLNLHIGALVTKWLPASKFGIATGIRFEVKGMQTGATVKNYGMTIIQDGGSVSGRWTGFVRTDYSSSQLTIPVLAVMQCNKRIKVNVGPYFSLALNNSFDGFVSDGYLREGDPTGNKVVFEGDDRAAYNFDDDLRLFLWGFQGGVSWKAMSHLNVNANLVWGCNGVFNSSFKTITFTMYPIYLNVGFGYEF